MELLSYNPRYRSIWFGLDPVSLAATQGIARVVFHTSEHNARTENDSMLFSFPLGTEMFHFPRCASTQKYVDNPYRIEFPHSDTSGSKVISHLPGAFRRLITSFIAFLSLGIHRAPFTFPVRKPEHHNFFLVMFTYIAASEQMQFALTYFYMSLITLLNIFSYQRSVFLNKKAPCGAV